MVATLLDRPGGRVDRPLAAQRALAGTLLRVGRDDPPDEPPDDPPWDPIPDTPPLPPIPDTPPLPPIPDTPPIE